MRGRPLSSLPVPPPDWKQARCERGLACHPDKKKPSGNTARGHPFVHREMRARLEAYVCWLLLRSTTNYWRPASPRVACTTPASCCAEGMGGGCTKHVLSSHLHPSCSLALLRRVPVGGLLVIQKGFAPDLEKLAKHSRGVPLTRRCKTSRWPCSFRRSRPPASDTEILLGRTRESARFGAVSAALFGGGRTNLWQ